jgi:hypothetical protein
VGHSSDDGQLLEIFLSEIRAIRLHDVEQLRDNRRHASKMPWAKRTAKMIA